MKNLSVSEIYEQATAAAKAAAYKTVEVFVKNERIYVSFPEESNKYNRAGFVEIATGKIFPACFKPRTSRDHDAISVLNAVSAIFNEEEAPKEEVPFVSAFLKF